MNQTAGTTNTQFIAFADASQQSECGPEQNMILLNAYSNTVVKVAKKFAARLCRSLDWPVSYQSG